MKNKILLFILTFFVVGATNFVSTANTVLAANVQVTSNSTGVRFTGSGFAKDQLGATITELGISIIQNISPWDTMIDVVIPSANLSGGMFDYEFTPFSFNPLIIGTTYGYSIMSLGVYTQALNVYTGSFVYNPGGATGGATLSVTATVLASYNEATVTLTATGSTTATPVKILYGTSSPTTGQSQSTTVSIPANNSMPYPITGLTASTNYFYSIISDDPTITPPVVYIPDTSFTTNPSVQGYDLGTGSSPVATCTDGADGYCLLAPIGGVTRISDADLANFFDMIFKILIGLIGTLSVIMIFFGGVQYMSTDALQGKQEGRERIQNAVLGLIIALGSYAILNTINPKLLNFTFGIDKVSIEYAGGDTSGPILTIGTGLFEPTGIVCTGSGGPSSIAGIVQSYVGNVTYKSPGGKGSPGPNNTVYYDCSGFVNKVLACAGMTYSSNATSGIFAGAEPVTSITNTSVNGITLNPGDLLGWTPANDPKNNGHVVIYIGNGLVAESHAPSDLVGKAVDTSSRHTSNYKNRIKYISRAH